MKPKLFGPVFFSTAGIALLGLFFSFLNCASTGERRIIGGEVKIIYNPNVIDPAKHIYPPLLERTNKQTFANVLRKMDKNPELEIYIVRSRHLVSTNIKGEWKIREVNGAIGYLGHWEEDLKTETKTFIPQYILDCGNIVLAAGVSFQMQLRKVVEIHVISAGQSGGRGVGGYDKIFPKIVTPIGAKNDCPPGGPGARP